jgi:hypothetical protein
MPLTLSFPLRKMLAQLVLEFKILGGLGRPLLGERLQSFSGAF